MEDVGWSVLDSFELKISKQMQANSSARDKLLKKVYEVYG